MARLSMYVPPFASDYSGACSVLFNMRCLVVVVDAGCCARNYVEYDETRWAKESKSTFSAQLRTLDALLGDDARIVEQAAELSRELDVECAALIGTPVPALVGMDLAGMASEAEAASGVPTVGIETTGFETYDVGVAAALEALLERFAFEPGADGARGTWRQRPRPCVNVLGAGPQDFMGRPALAELEDGLRAAGLDIAFSTASAYGPGDVRAACDADASIVVATAGLPAARLLRERCGVPFVVGRPFAPADCARLAQMATAAGEADAPLLLWDRPAEPPAAMARALCDSLSRGAFADGSGALSAVDRKAPVLLVGDQVAMCSLRRHMLAALEEEGSPREVAVASFFAWEDAWARPCDVRLADGESALESWAREHPGAGFVGDPLLRRIPDLAASPFAVMPHEAVSSTLFLA